MSDVYQFSIDLPVGAAALYRAFTDERMLTKWLTEFAHVSLADGIYELSGRYLPEAPERPATRSLPIIPSP